MGRTLARMTHVLDSGLVGAREALCAGGGRVVRSALTLTGSERLANRFGVLGSDSRRDPASA